MKVRFTAGRVRVRIDDLELSALRRGEILDVQVTWPGGGWSLRLDPRATDLTGTGGRLTVGLSAHLDALLDPAEEGITLPGLPRVTVEKDFGPQHA
ncbi:hypothetical protein LAJ19_13035 [Deinococcus taeanensis]|uniref:hypothetical protein n=1 Tax=Deinococcus taeanensis TaxID=2737050 RepID=UPI001CDB8724|nr:hypothetical protein [Deinococcus taeanensis]UBV42535.1 hypothetical protein LAJ19_13035 [Deinococcus taeanensis]